MNLAEISTKRRNGTEKFLIKSCSLDFSLSEFWSWNQSNLIENRTRGILAEFIVKEALEIESKSRVRVEWDNYDLETNKGSRLEIKSAAYIQSWKQKQYSTITFGIGPSAGAPDHSEYDGVKRRWADFYVFCLLRHKDQETINPLDMEQWVFYVLPTVYLDRYKPEQKTIGLNSLLRLNPAECKFSELKEVIEK